MSEQMNLYAFWGLAVLSGVLLILLVLFVTLYTIRLRSQSKEKQSYDLLNKTAELIDVVGKTTKLSVHNCPRVASSVAVGKFDVELDITMIHTQESIDGLKFGRGQRSPLQRS